MLISVVLIRSQPIFPSLMPCMKCLFSSGFIYSFFFLSFFLWLQQFEYNTPHVVLFIFIPLAVHRGSCLWRLMYFNKFGKIHHQCAGNFLFVFKHFSIPSPTNSIFQTLCQLVLTRFGQWEAAGNDWKGEGGSMGISLYSLCSSHSLNGLQLLLSLRFQIPVGEKSCMVMVLASAGKSRILHFW